MKSTPAALALAAALSSPLMALAADTVVLGQADIVGAKAQAKPKL